MSQGASFKSRMIKKYKKSCWNEHCLNQNMSVHVVKRSEYENIYAFMGMSNLSEQGENSLFVLFLCF